MRQQKIMLKNAPLLQLTPSTSQAQHASQPVNFWPFSNNAKANLKQLCI